MKIDWVNHASFILRLGPVSLISDPWLVGTAFDDGWSLLSPTKFTPDDFGTITHLWLSHEHPDHFSPASLRSIPGDSRRNIVVLFQETEDQKIVDFCRQLGFEDVIELPSGAWHSLTPDVDVMCQPYPDDDSWLAIRAGGRVLLNLNDCMVRSPRAVQRIRDQVEAPIDLLLTQFSYANWVGNRGDLALHRRAAASLLDRVQLQTTILRPKWVIPFASFVRFAHVENDYLNEAMNSAADAYERVRATTSAEPVVLYPGDSWTVGADWDSGPALANYARDAAAAREASTLVTAPVVPIDELKGVARDYSRTLVAHHGRARLWGLQKLGLLTRAAIYLSDHKRSVSFGLDGGLRASRMPRDRCDVELGSAALAYCFRFVWGGNTLLVNGRYQVPAGGHFERFRRYLVLSDLANHDKGLGDYVFPRAKRVRDGVIDRVARRSA